jgi:hypothetical protein
MLSADNEPPLHTTFFMPMIAAAFTTGFVFSPKNGVKKRWHRNYGGGMMRKAKKQTHTRFPV